MLCLVMCLMLCLQDAVNTYRNSCEHPKPQYSILNGKGVGRYDAPCTACAAS